MVEHKQARLPCEQDQRRSMGVAETVGRRQAMRAPTGWPADGQTACLHASDRRLTDTISTLHTQGWGSLTLAPTIPLDALLMVQYQAFSCDLLSTS